MNLKCELLWFLKDMYENSFYIDEPTLWAIQGPDIMKSISL